MIKYQLVVRFQSDDAEETSEYVVAELPIEDDPEDSPLNRTRLLVTALRDVANELERVAASSA